MSCIVQRCVFLCAASGVFADVIEYQVNISTSSISGAAGTEESHGEGCLSGAVSHAGEPGGNFAEEHPGVLRVSCGIDSGYLQPGEDIGQRGNCGAIF